MACQAVRPWTFSGLVGAFLDLAIAYLLLCASALAFFASKFLGFFGLCLPCPCNGLFGSPNRNYCLQRLIVDCPIDAVSSVQLAVKSKFPFDSIWARERDYQLNLKLIRDKDESYVDGFLEMEGEASCSDKLGAVNSENVGEKDLVLRNNSRREIEVVNPSLHVKEGRFDLKGKGIVNQRPRSRLRRRRKILTDYAKVSHVSCLEPSGVEVILEHKGSSLPVDSGADADRINYDDDASIAKHTGERASHDFEFTEPIYENETYEKNEASFEEIKSNVQKELGYEGNEKSAIRILEQALEEEHAARTALYLELEKERNAAAGAADEAMAMILRLQEEKASVEMEARQYQRIIEEKSAYDAEEMNILKEILVRRETEKHFLEKEVEAYRQMIYTGNQQLQDDDNQDIVNTQGEQRASSSFDMGEDPVLMLQQLSESIDKREIVKDESAGSELSPIEKQTCTLSAGEELRISGWDEETDGSKQGDLDQQFLSSGSLDQYFSEKSILLAGEQQERIDNAYQQEGMATETTETHDLNALHIPCDGENLEQHGNDTYQGNMILALEPDVHDVHVIDGNIYDERLLENDASNVARENDLPLNVAEIQRIDVTTDCQSSNGLDSEPDFNRSNSNMTARLPPLGRSSAKSKSILSELRRNSMPAVDTERLKIDSEVEWLRERLRIVQEGRGKLNVSVEHRERERLQLQLLEDIACQLREIRQLTEPGNVMRQTSLPLPCPKGLPKKRRCRSVSMGVHKSL